MLHDIYHMYRKVKSMEKVRINKNPTSNQRQDTPTTKSAFKNMIIVTFELHGFQLQPSKV